MRKVVWFSMLVALAAAACSGGGTSGFPEGSFAVQAASDIGVGPGRILIGIVGPDNTRLGAPDQPIEIEVAHADEPGTPQRAPGIFTFIIPGEIGLYRAEFDFDRPGAWDVTVIPESGPEMQTALSVRPDPLAPAIGEKAPPAPSPTLDDLPIEALTTDDDPDPQFYEMSVAEAVTSGRRSVLVFSTPAFCQTEACGPLLDTVKEVAPQYPDVNFVHVEIYEDFRDPGFSPLDPSYLAPAVTPEWFNLPSEPWVFVLDETGTVVARFEGVMAGEELDPYLG